MNINYIHLKEIDSTNSYAKRYASEKGALPALIIADKQTAGRGRMGKRYFSSDVGGLYMTLVLKAPPKNVFMRATALAAVCAVEAIKELYNIDTQIKWVNDIFYNSKKAGGILSESFFVDGERYVAVGFGINLYIVSFPVELKNIAISLFSCYPNEQKQYESRKQLADIISEKFFEVVKTGNIDDVMKRYREKCFVVNRWVVYECNGRKIKAFAFDVTEDGALAVRTGDGVTHYLSSGEVSVTFDD